MGEALYSRLKALKERNGGSGVKSPGGRDRFGGAAAAFGISGQKRAALSPPSQWRRIAEGVCHRVRRFHTGYRVEQTGTSGADKPGPMVLPEQLLSLAGSESSFLFPAPQKGILFFDCETTGLSGGAGNTVFLFGIGYREEESTVVEQFFLEDFPDEPEFLGTIAERLSPEYTYVSYNGRSFDATLLRSRFLLNGLRFPMERHVDLLYPARRLWRRRLDSCSLGTVERRVLGIKRKEDLPGAEVPLRYFDYLRSGRWEGLAPVFSHHAYDIAGLVLLADLIDRVTLDHHLLSEPIYDGLGLASLLCNSNREEIRRRGVALFEDLVRSAADRPGPWSDGPFVARRLARYYRREGNRDGIGRVWRIVWEKNRSVAAAVEWAKYLEHCEKSFDKALSLVGSLLTRGVEEPLLSELIHRHQRLLRRVADS